MPKIYADEELIEAIKAKRDHGDEHAAAKSLGISVQTFRYRHSQAVERGLDRPGAGPRRPVDPEKVGLNPNGVPMSEIQRKFHEDWGPEDCIKELRRVVERGAGVAITRNHFRVYSQISDSTWNRFFGTFLEFKRQAGIQLSRHAHRIERNIAKHASVDRMRELNEEKRGWEGKFLMPDSRRWQTVIALCDIHDRNCDPFYLRVALDTVRRVLPAKIVLNGDIFDLAEFSKHEHDPRTFDIVARIKWVNSFLASLREASPNSEIIFTEGNHEFRLLRHMGEQTPALKVVLSDLHDFTISKLLGLDAYGVNYVARADMTAWTESSIRGEIEKNYAMLYGNALLFGHYSHMREMGIPGASGHEHKHLVWSFFSADRGPWEWHQSGCGHQRRAVYTAGEKWGNGFLLAHVDTMKKHTQFEYIDTSFDHAVVGGKFYERAPREYSGAGALSGAA
jgi:hypothetical protein